MTIYHVHINLYVPGTNRRAAKNDQKSNTVPAAMRHEHGLGHYLLGREGRAR